MEPKNETAWWISNVTRSKVTQDNVIVVPPNKATLQIYIERKGNQNISYASLQAGENIIQTRLNVGHFLQQSNRDNGPLQISICNHQHKTINDFHITSWEFFYGPQENHDAKACSIVTNSDSVNFDIPREQKIDLYSSACTKVIRQALIADKAFIVKFTKGGKDFLKVKVEKASNAARIWWDGCKPLIMMSHPLQWRRIGEDVDLISQMITEDDEAINPEVIEINLDEDQKSESGYWFKKYVAYASIIAAGRFIIGILCKIKSTGSEFL